MKLAAEKLVLETAFGKRLARVRMLLRGDLPANCKLTTAITEVKRAHLSAM
jgi:hypothetical protein